ncbi:type II toxin-antitoxin system RelE/ParE family toxin [Pseudoalteromonas sp. Z9A5]|uniref:type II toxin-antitoxin system RelE/ParE family toxin n=1 Tax=Pseudoalteromonas sp. Z9A5 TaxID=2686355 RepID=UPI00140E817A|nr:type II toxin-antitoxin system RelE/ParE family toxin [Pseudoalteromonas sp. Z9A5]
MKKFAFTSAAAEREFRNLPQKIKSRFALDIKALCQDEKPFSPIKPLSSIGPGVIELKINGKPAFRCIYIAKFNDCITILHSFKKTTNGVDRPAMEVAKLRYKEFKQRQHS